MNDKLMKSRSRRVAELALLPMIFAVAEPEAAEEFEAVFGSDPGSDIIPVTPSLGRGRLFSEEHFR